MKRNSNNHLVIKISLLGALIATIIYLFHPADGLFSVMINGEPITDPIVHLAAIPILFTVLFFTGILLVLAVWGAGLLVFLSALMFMILGVFIIVPYSWPMLVIIILIMALMSFDDNKNT